MSIEQCMPPYRVFIMVLQRLSIPLILAMAACGTGAQQLEPRPIEPKPILPESFQWLSPHGNSALKIAWLIGAEKEPGMYAARVSLRKGGRIPAHTHPDARYSTVLSGTLYVGFGEDEDERNMVAVPAGGVYVAPAGVPHYLYARDSDVVYQEGGVGPSATVFIE